MPAASKFCHEVASYEASRSGHERQIVQVQLTHLRSQAQLVPTISLASVVSLNSL